jgi:hypothetical protein
LSCKFPNTAGLLWIVDVLRRLNDLTFQAWVLTNAGLKVRGCFLCHINPDFVRRGEVDPKKFFVLEDVSA